MKKQRIIPAVLTVLCAAFVFSSYAKEDAAPKDAAVKDGKAEAPAQPAEKKDTKKGKPKKVSELLAKANDLMADAQSAYMDGESKKAIELYRDALKEIDRVEEENADRVDSAEFAPVRFRRALCETEIDRIMLEDVSATSRTIAVTDTSALEKKRAERKRAAESNHVEDATIKLSARKSANEALIAEKKAEADARKKEKEKEKQAVAAISPLAELEFAKDMFSMDRLKDAENSLIKVLRIDPENRQARFLLALVQLRDGRAGDATVILDDLLADNPKDEAVLLLAAAACSASANYPKAMEHLDAAMKSNPTRPDGYYNMAWLLLELKPGETKDAAAYYRQSVKLGGRRDAELERRLGMKTE
ncbi:MAG: tetratricopeptide repeat protein [Kiritimatiellae bacterium]|nr:tetratricopeptide repeat protein [Kiritimatiellia bacterium]